MPPICGGGGGWGAKQNKKVHILLPLRQTLIGYRIWLSFSMKTRNLGQIPLALRTTNVPFLTLLLKPAALYLLMIGLLNQLSIAQFELVATLLIPFLAPVFPFVPSSKCLLMWPEPFLAILCNVIIVLWSGTMIDIISFIATILIRTNVTPPHTWSRCLLGTMHGKTLWPLKIGFQPPTRQC